jgi:hypothetical protein
VGEQAGVLSGEQTRKLFEHARENKVSKALDQIRSDRKEYKS